MDIIVRGESREIDFVRCICRDKVRRGLLAILPATRPASDDVVVRLRKERDETTKENERLKERVAELERQLSNVESSLSNVESLSDNVESVPEIVNSAEIESCPETSDVMDDKYIDNDDLQEVDLDADDKTLSGDDSKDVQAMDAKEASTAKKKSRRSKKSE